MHETISDARDRNFSSLRVVHAEGTIKAMPVRSVTQFTVQLREILLQMEAEVLQLGRALLPALKPLPAAPESG